MLLPCRSSIVVRRPCSRASLRILFGDEQVSLDDFIVNPRSRKVASSSTFQAVSLPASFRLFWFVVSFGSRPKFSTHSGAQIGVWSDHIHHRAFDPPILMSPAAKGSRSLLTPAAISAAWMTTSYAPSNSIACPQLR
jgi:hypothetical protein